MPDSIEIVEKFCELMEKRDPDELRTFLADDAVYQNVGTPASFGAQAISANLANQFARFPDSYAYKLVNIAAAGDVVLTERLDMIRVPTGEVTGVPVMGTFVLRDGKILRWTDYWDTSLPRKMMTGDNVDDLLPRY